MDQRIESFLGDVLELAGEDPDVVHDEVRAFLSDYEAIFRAQESNRRMRDKAAHACRALCRLLPIALARARFDGEERKWRGLAAMSLNDP